MFNQNLHTGAATGRLRFTRLGAIAQFETESRAERQKEGIQQAKARGVRLGRKEALTAPECLALRQQRVSCARIKTLMKDYKLSKCLVMS